MPSRFCGFDLHFGYPPERGHQQCQCAWINTNTFCQKTSLNLRMNHNHNINFNRNIAHNHSINHNHNINLRFNRRRLLR